MTCGGRAGSRYTSVVDDVIAQLRQTNETVLELVTELRQNRHGITVTHTQSGLSGWNIAAVTACFFTSLMLIALAIIIIPDIHDLRAWRDIHSAKIARLEAAQEHKP